MNYIGSKLKLLPFIYQTITETIKNNKAKPLNESTFCDLFAGTGCEAKAFKSQVKQVIANDKEYYSFVLNQNYIFNHISLKNIDLLFKELNSDILTPHIEGKIYHNYCLAKQKFIATNFKTGLEKRQYFSDENGAKIDAIRIKIQNWKEKGKINENIYFHLLASLLESADKVANTASVYGAFLKHLKKSASKPMEFIPALFECNDNTHLVFNENANTLIKKIKGDVLYLDPPYNAREYGANYHLLNTIALFEWVFLSYNDEGLLTLGQIKELFSKYGKYS